MRFKIANRYTLDPVNVGDQVPSRSYYPGAIIVALSQAPSSQYAGSVLIRHESEAWASEVPLMDAGLTAIERYLP